MEQIRRVVLCYFFNKLTYNPKDKIKNLHEEVRNLLDDQFIFSEEDISHLFSMPRVQALSKDKKLLFQMSLINANISFNVSDMENDDVILWINNHLQLFFDVLKEVFEVKILYSSVKLEIVYENNDAVLLLTNKYHFDEELENITINRGYALDDTYYVNILLNSNKEYNFNFPRDSETKMIEQDLFDMTMVTSLSDAEFSKSYVLETIEVNDRLAFNLNKDYLSTKENVRGMIIELKKYLKLNTFDEK